MSFLDNMAEENGFESNEQMCRLIASVDLTNPWMLEDFNQCKEEGGAYDGLVKVINKEGEK